MTSQEVAEQIIKVAFKDKLDKSGKPYIDHLYKVAESYKDGSIMKVVALLHDLLEDCEYWNIKSLSCFFSEDVIDALIAITRIKNEPYKDYILRVDKNPFARSVKIQDLLHNMDITRLKKIGDEDIKRIKKYHRAYIFIQNGVIIEDF